MKNELWEKQCVHPAYGSDDSNAAWYVLLGLICFVILLAVYLVVSFHRNRTPAEKYAAKKKREEKREAKRKLKEALIPKEETKVEPVDDTPAPE